MGGAFRGRGRVFPRGEPPEAVASDVEGWKLGDGVQVGKAFFSRVRRHAWRESSFVVQPSSLICCSPHFCQSLRHQN